MRAKYRIVLQSSFLSFQNRHRICRCSSLKTNSEENNFVTKTDKGDLKIYFGDPSTHSGNFVFQTDVKGTLSRAWQWPVKVFLAIMDLPGDKTVKISDQGAAEITVDSGLAVYCYRLPAQAK